MSRIIVIVGPTAGGKSELAITIAQALGGEIINADSMQVYRGLDAGTAKPSIEQRRAVPHHLINFIEPTHSFTVADWLLLADSLIGALQTRGVLPIVVGGTNLYLKALLEGMFEGPPGDEAFRSSLDEFTPHQLHERLIEVDPSAAERIHPNDRKRIVRALEVFHTTGKPISLQQQQWIESPADQPAGAKYRHDPILIGLRWSVEAINRRINARVKRMFAPENSSEDLLSETRRLRDAGLLGQQASEAIGTKQVLAHLAGEYPLEYAIEQVKIETRRFTKAQRTWLKRYRGVHWLDADQSSAQQLAEQAVAWVRKELGR